MSISTTAPNQLVGNNTSRLLIIITVMTVAILEVLDTTIVNVALSDMMGALGATSDQITWVLTSYIVASAIFMPLTGFLDKRLGRRNFLLIAISGFLFSSMMCGLTSSLDTMIIFRVLQGAFGASLIPLSQSTMREIFPLSEQGKAMAIWGLGIMAAPILGPTIGGYIVEGTSWRWIFYINVPICFISFFLALTVIKQTKTTHGRIDWVGLILMAVGAAGFQIFLDEGNQNNWFESHGILALFLLSIICIILFIARGIKISDNIINLKLFKDRNFYACTLMISIVAACMFGMIAIQPLMMQNIMGYPAITAGLLMAPRGLATGCAMLMVPKLLKSLNIKTILITGILLSSCGAFLMSSVNLDISPTYMIVPGLLQGLGMGFIFVPLSVLALSSIDKSSMAEAAGLFSYGRMFGSSIGISTLSTITTRATQTNWNQLVGHINPYNHNLTHWLQVQHLSLKDPTAIARLGSVLQQQASMIAFVDCYWLIAIAFIVLLPLVFLLKKVNFQEVPTEVH